MTAAIYARISDDRKGKNVSIESQLKDCRVFVHDQGWDAVEFVDKNISAFNGDLRDRYLEMLVAAKVGKVDRIVAYDLDRLYRDPRELEDLIALADPRRQKPLHVYDPDGDLNLHTEGGITAARSRVNTANMESRSKSRRVKRAKKTIREGGYGSGGPRPFGWKALQATDQFGKPAFKRNGAAKMIWARDQYEATEVALIKTAITDLLKGASLRDIARRWNADGIRQPQDRSRHGWTANIVRLVVTNPRLAGLIGHRQQVMDENGTLRYLPVEVVGPAKDLGTPIIDRPTWEQLQELLKQRGANNHAPRHRSLLTGLVTCAKCGETMKRSGARGQNGNGYTRKVWRCYPPANNQGGWAGHAAIDADGLEAWLIDATLRRADTTSLAAMMRDRGRQGQQARDLVAELAVNRYRNPRNLCRQARGPASQVADSDS